MSDSVHLSIKLAVALGAVWLVLAGPAVFLAGALGLEGLTLAVLLCLLPRLAQDGLALVVRPATHPLVELLLGMALRLVLVCGGAVAICLFRPELRDVFFFVGLGLGYVVALSVETRFSVEQGRRSPGSVPETLLGS